MRARRAAGPIVGMLLALTVAASGLVFQHRRAVHERYDRFRLPAFDAYVYVAMAEQPRVFTVAPWGYRPLSPLLARVLPGHSAGGFRYLTAVALLGAGVLLFLFLRRLGAGTLPALLGVAVFSLSPPVREAVATRFLVEPVTVALEVGLLLALEAGAGSGVAALLLALGALSKEAFALFAPAVAFALAPRRGARRAALATAAAAVPGVIGLVALRLLWQPHLEAAPALPELAVVPLAAAWRDWIPALLLWGLTPLAALGAFTPPGRVLLRRYGYLLLVTLALPFAAGAYVTEGPASHFFVADVRRLLIYALPLLIALALCLPRWLAVESPPARPRPAVEAACGVLALAVASAPVLAADRYRRLDLGGPRDGPYVLGFCRETLRTTRRLARGDAVAFDEGQRFDWGVSDPSELSRLRWFLREGWGLRPHYSQGRMVTREREATLVLPVRPPRDVEVELVLESPRASTLVIRVNGQRREERPLGTGAQTVVLRLPKSALVRGDNLLGLSAEPGLRLVSLGYRPL